MSEQSSSLDANITLPQGYFGNPSDPLLEFCATATYLDCHIATVYCLEQRGELVSEPIEAKNDAPGFRLSELAKLKERRNRDNSDGTYDAEDGRRLKLKKAAPIVRVPYRTLLNLLRKKKGFAASKGIVPQKIDFRRGNAETIKQTEALQLQRLISLALKRGKPKGFDICHEIGKRLGLKTRSHFIELRQCLRCWQKNQLLNAELILSRQRGKVTTRSHTVIAVERLHEHTVYEVTKAVELWKLTCSVQKGIELLRRLLYGRSLFASEVKDEMGRSGFAGVRFDKVCRAAHIVRKPSNGYGSPWVYELRQTTPSPAIDVLRNIFANGPVDRHDFDREVRAAGCSPYSGQVKKARSDLGISPVCAERLESNSQLVGQYASQQCKVGDCLHCEAADREVVVAGIHDAPIRWPYALVPGRHQLILCGDLVHAVRTETIPAIAQAWGVCEDTVRRWRRILHVPAGKRTHHYLCLPDQEVLVKQAGSLPQAAAARVTQGSDLGKVNNYGTSACPQYPGYTKRQQTTGLRRDESKEAVMAYCYRKHVLENYSRQETMQSAQEWFPSSEAPKTENHVRDLVKRWSARHIPPLPLKKGEDLAAIQALRTALGIMSDGSGGRKTHPPRGAQNSPICRKSSVRHRGAQNS